MEHLGLNDLREMFLTFFESKQHLRMKSASLVPHNDKNLLLINSGMAQFKTFFTGQETPPSKRVVTCQKCIRTNDIENVGITARHGTFFEMLGNFSFGDYFKNEIINWSWEFCTEVLKLPTDRLYVSVYEKDDETYDIWHKKMGLPHTHLKKLGKDDNFWEVGPGPCGPCSEIHYDRGEQFGCNSPDCGVGCNCDRYIEFWNLVFTQYNREEDGTYTDLEHPNIDTGMGLERIATIMQDVNSIFDIDTIKNVRDKVCELAKTPYNSNKQKDISIRIITDHTRSVTFMMADGVQPSNEGRGYVLRRLLRRAIRHAKLLGIEHVFMTEISQIVIENSKDAYPELEEKKDYILKIIQVEEARFHDTLGQGMELLKDLIQSVQGDSTRKILGKDVFRLYDTFGFPIELTKEILEEVNIQLDENDFLIEMEAQKERARNAREKGSFMGAEQQIYSQINKDCPPTQFLGYDSLKIDNAKILFIINENNFTDIANEGDNISIILDKTTFYAESGGQKGDIGIIKTQSAEILVTDTIKVIGNKIAHIGNIKSGTIKTNEQCSIEVSKKNRMNISRNHTATHLLHEALRETLGNHVEQSGSSVSNERLRFDFAHFEMLTQDEIEKVEQIVNKKILQCLNVDIKDMPVKEAKDMGATALFGEKYGDIVRVVSIEDYSTELCGGTHTNNTSVIGIFKIIYEGSVGTGLRRIEAITGESAFNYYKEINNRIHTIDKMLKSGPANAIQKLELFLEESKNLKKKLEKLNAKSLTSTIDELIDNKIIINGLNIITANVNSLDTNNLKKIGDEIKSKLGNSVIVLTSYKDEKVNLIVMASEEIIKQGVHAGKIIKQIAPIIDGSGGGSPTVAQAGGKNREKINEALNFARESIKKMLE